MLAALLTLTLPGGAARAATMPVAAGHASTPPASTPPAADADAAAFQHARGVADEVLRRPEFDRDRPLTWLDRKKAQLLGLLVRLFAQVDRLGQSTPWLSTALMWLFGVGAAAGLLTFLLRQMARQRLRVSLGGGVVQTEAWSREASDWAERAEAFARNAQWRDAVHCLYWAAIVLLESRRAWRHNPTRTPREYVRLLKVGSAQQQGLRGLTQVLERVWYGLREADGEQYAQARALYEQLAGAAQPAVPPNTQLGTEAL